MATAFVSHADAIREIFQILDSCLKPLPNLYNPALLHSLANGGVGSTFGQTQLIPRNELNSFIIIYVPIALSQAETYFRQTYLHLKLERDFFVLKETTKAVVASLQQVYAKSSSAPPSTPQPPNPPSSQLRSVSNGPIPSPSQNNPNSMALILAPSAAPSQSNANDGSLLDQLRTASVQPKPTASASSQPRPPAAPPVASSPKPTLSKAKPEKKTATKPTPSAAKPAPIPPPPSNPPRPAGGPLPAAAPAASMLSVFIPPKPQPAAHHFQAPSPASRAQPQPQPQPQAQPSPSFSPNYSAYPSYPSYPVPPPMPAENIRPQNLIKDNPTIAIGPNGNSLIHRSFAGPHLGQPDAVKIPLQAFQLEMLSWLRYREETAPPFPMASWMSVTRQYRGGICALDMGLGKTGIMLALFSMSPRARPRPISAASPSSSASSASSASPSPFAPSSGSSTPTAQKKKSSAADNLLDMMLGIAENLNNKPAEPEKIQMEIKNKKKKKGAASAEPSVPINASAADADAAAAEAIKITPLPEGGTLVICPRVLIDHWLSEKDKFLGWQGEDTLRIVPYYDAQDKRKATAQSLAKADIVVTTFGSVMSEYKQLVTGHPDINSMEMMADFAERGKFLGMTPLYGVRWHRIVIDESYKLKNDTSLTHAATFALVANRRWCLNATPVHNAVEDLTHQLHFVRCFVNCAQSREVIPQYFRGVVMRIQKADERDGRPLVILPEKHMEQRCFELNDDERQFYSDLEKDAAEFVEAMSDYDFDKGAMKFLGSRTQVFQLLLRQRQACDHPLLVIESFKKRANGAFEPILQKAAECQSAEDCGWDETCCICGKKSENALIFKCLHSACMNCIMPRWRDVIATAREDGERGTITLRCSAKLSEERRCRRPIAINDCMTRSLIEAAQRMVKATLSSLVTSTKVDAIVDVICEKVKAGGQVVVFCHFLQFIEILSQSLRKNGIDNSRIIGSQSQFEQKEAVEDLANHRVPVLLASVFCAGVGLNLVAANTVIMADAWWNSSVDRQAIDRVHRIGQRKEVFVYQMKTESTVEDRIFAMQETKSTIADSILGDTNLYESQRVDGEISQRGRSGLTMNDMLRLLLPRGSARGAKRIIANDDAPVREEETIEQEQADTVAAAASAADDDEDDWAFSSSSSSSSSRRSQPSSAASASSYSAAASSSSSSSRSRSRAVIDDDEDDEFSDIRLDASPAANSKSSSFSASSFSSPASATRPSVSAFSSSSSSSRPVASSSSSAMDFLDLTEDDSPKAVKRDRASFSGSASSSSSAPNSASSKKPKFEPAPSSSSSSSSAKKPAKAEVINLDDDDEFDALLNTNLI